jgi:hypothetical protein
LVDRIFTGETEEHLNSKDFIMRVMEKPNFISSIIFKKEVLEIGKSYYQDKYFGYSFFAQMYFGILLSGGNCLYYYFPLVIQRNPSKTWEKYWAQFLISSLSEIFKDMEPFETFIYKKWMSKLRKDIPKNINAVARYKSYYRKDEIKRKMKKHMTKIEKFWLYYYLYMPGASKFYVWKMQFLGAINRILA